MGLHSFVAGTPLHVMISLSLIRQLNLYNNSHLKIIDYFAGAEGVFERFSGLDWDYSGVKVSLFDSHRRAYLDCIKDKTEQLYIDSDASFQRHLDLIAIKSLRPRMKINVFEDGVGSYRTDLYSGVKKRIFGLLGVGTFLGGSPFTQSIFIYEKERYRETFPTAKCNAVSIDETLFETIARLEPYLHRIFSYTPNLRPQSDKCVVYLSNHHIHTGLIEGLRSAEGDVFVKLHPRIKRFDSIPGIEFLDNNVPAEVILRYLSDIYKDIEVHHHGSSAEQYIVAEKIRFVRI